MILLGPFQLEVYYDSIYTYVFLYTRISAPVIGFGGVPLAGCQAPTQLLSHTPPQQDWEEYKMQKNPSWVKIKTGDALRPPSHRSGGWRSAHPWHRGTQLLRYLHCPTIWISKIVWQVPFTSTSSMQTGQDASKAVLFLPQWLRKCDYVINPHECIWGSLPVSAFDFLPKLQPA